MAYKKRQASPGLPQAVSDLIESNNQYAQMVVYWGTSCNSLQAQLKNLMREWQKTGLHELIEVSNEDMETMRAGGLIIGIPMYFSRYLDGVTKVYPVPEEKISG